MHGSLRGKRQGTNQVAKEFWLKARGTEFACKFFYLSLSDARGRRLMDVDVS
jgi:hypothetical protein